MLEMHEYIFCVSSVFTKSYFYSDIIFVIRCYVLIAVNLYFNVVNMIVHQEDIERMMLNCQDVHLCII